LKTNGCAGSKPAKLKNKSVKILSNKFPFTLFVSKKILVPLYDYFKDDF
jgi:hypothetical protein